MMGDFQGPMGDFGFSPDNFAGGGGVAGGTFNVVNPPQISGTPLQQQQLPDNIPLSMEQHIQQTNERLQCIMRDLRSMNTFQNAARELLEWCGDARAFQPAYEANLMGCLTIISKFASCQGYDLDLGYRLLAVCAAHREKLSRKSSGMLSLWCEELGRLLLLRHQRKTDGKPFVNAMKNMAAPMPHGDNTIAWQPNNPQQANVSVTVSSVWGVSSAPTVVNPMMPMQSGGGITQGVGSQYDPSLDHVPMKSFPNQGFNPANGGMRGNEMPNIQNVNNMNNEMFQRQNNMNFNQGGNTPPNQANNFQQFQQQRNPNNPSGPFPAAAAAAAAVAAAAATATATATVTATLHMPDQTDQVNTNGEFMDNQQYQVQGQTQFQTRGGMNTAMNRAMFNNKGMGGYMGGLNNMGGYMPQQRPMGYPAMGQQPMGGTMNSPMVAAAQRNMMRYPGPPLKRSPSMMGYNQQMMGGSPMSTDPPGAQFGPFGPGPGGMNKAGPFPPQYQPPPGYNAPGPYGPNMGNMVMGGTMPGGMGMPPQYSMNNTASSIGNMMQQPGNIMPMPSQRRPSTLQYQPSPTSVPPESPSASTNSTNNNSTTSNSNTNNNNRYMSICDTPTTTGSLDVKPNIGLPTQQLKSAVTTSVGSVVGPDVKPLIKPDKECLRLTFYVANGMVLQPFRLQHNLAVSNHAFFLKPQIHQTLMSRPDLELQFKCYHHEDKAMTTNWPNSVSVSVNNTPLNLERGENKTSHKPLLLKNVCKPGRNTIQINVLVCCCSHLFVLQLVHRPSVNSVLQGLLKKRLLPAEHCMKKIKYNFTTSAQNGNTVSSAEDGVEQTAIKVSLKCPITYRKINVPARGHECKHIQCFDLESYLKLNVDKGTWKCPVCCKSAVLEGLEVDQYLWQIITTLTKTEVEEVTIDASASWKPVSVKQEVKQEDRNSCPSVAPPKRLKSVESSSNIDSPMSISNPSPNGNFKPPTPGGTSNSCTPNSLQAQNSLQGPKTPQSLAAPSSGDPKFAVASPVGMAPVSSQPQLSRQQSTSSSVPATTAQPNACHVNNTQGGPPTLLRSPGTSCPPGSSATTSSTTQDEDSKRNDGDAWNNGEFNLENMFNAAEASGTVDNEDEEGNLDVLPDNLDANELLSYLGPPDLPSEDLILSMFDGIGSG